MRLAMVACEAVIVAVLIDLLRRLALPVTAVVAWAWHPLAIWEIANNGHADALMVALLMIGVWLLVRARSVAGAVAVALAALVKPYAVLSLPAFWRPWDWRAPLAVAAAILAAICPISAPASGVLGFVTTGLSVGGRLYRRRAHLARRACCGPLSAIFRADRRSTWPLRPSIMIALGLRYRFDPQRARRARRSCDVGVLLTAGLVLLSPNYAWYFLAVVPFIPLGGGAPAWAMTLGAILLYRPAMLPAQRSGLENARHASRSVRRCSALHRCVGGAARVSADSRLPERPPSRRSSASSFPASTRRSRSPASLPKCWRRASTR